MGLPSFGVKGRAVSERILRGELGFPSLGTVGRVNISRNAKGVFRFAPFGVTGSFLQPQVVDYPIIFKPVSADASFPPYAVSIRKGQFATGSLGFPHFDFGGSLAQPFQVNAVAGFGALRTGESRVEVPLGVRAVATFPLFATTSEIFVPPLEVRSNFGLPAFGHAGRVNVPPVILDGGQFPTLSLSAELSRSVFAGGAMGFNGFRTAGYIDLVLKGVTGAVLLPAFGTQGDVELARDYDASLTLPAFGMNGRLDTPLEIFGSMTFAPFGLVGEFEQLLPVEIDAALAFPAFGMYGRAVQRNNSDSGFNIAVRPRRRKIIMRF